MVLDDLQLCMSRRSDSRCCTNPREWPIVKPVSLEVKVREGKVLSMKLHTNGGNVKVWGKGYNK